MQHSPSELSNEAKAVVASYLSLPSLGVRTPYHNNRRHELRGGLRALAGKGTPGEIVEEAALFAIREKVKLTDTNAGAPANRTKFLIDHNLGIDCSGFVYHVLDAESRARGKGSLRSHISFHHRGLVRRLLARFRPAQNVGVRTLIEEKNSREVPLAEVQPGDFITMTHEKEGRAFDHVILITDVTKNANTDTILTYTHSIAWPSDGEYGHGVRTGSIELIAPDDHIKNQKWIEQGKMGQENYTHQRALKADGCAVRRVKYF